MANRVKEDERNERIIRGLLKLPENRRCINCNSLGPQYVCTNFWTFVCTTCSGIHREFTHRVKSVSMAKFTSQEVTALQEGGNKRARDIYLKEWDPQRQSAPDVSNVDRLRDFIKHVYVDRRYTGDRNSGKPPSVKLGDKEDSYHGGSRSPPYEDSYERRYSEMSSPGGRSDDRNSRYGYDERRSPGYDQESRQYNDYRRSPEVVNDWRREDRFGNGKRADDRRVSDGESKLESRSPERPKDPEASSPPVVRPVREILGDNIVPLRISEPPKANLRAADGSSQTQRTASSSSLGSANGNPTEVKLENTVSLIDFDADPEPPVTTAVRQAQQTPASQSIAQPATTTNDNNWASFDFAPEIKVSQVASTANPLESVLSQLSVPASAPGQISGMPSGSGAPLAANAANLTITGASPVLSTGNAPVLPPNGSASAVTPVNSLSAFIPVGISSASPGLAPQIPVSGGNSFVKVNEAGQWPNVQHSQPFLFPVSSGQSTTQQFTPPFNGASGNQPWNLSAAPNVQTSLSTSSMGATQVVSTPGVSQPPVMEIKSSGRQELPADLFTATYSSFPAPVPGWQTTPPHGVGFAMQYINAAAPMPTSIQPSKSMNPFDLNEPSTVQAQTFPSMASLQSALPNMPTSSGLQRTSSLGAPSAAWMPSHSLPYPSALPPQALSYASAVPPRVYMAQQVSNNMPLSGHQGAGGFGADGAAFGAMNTNQQLAGRFPAPAAPSPFSSVGGNPFG
ncbi:probable ADP-ribosylation factor GTPase-activating protein AGD14 isoform X2 [Ricinus communis]|uniref:probable ADP-ribosylation factor GTPase-activating protein AGD14 isoform X2 n=1 Tax=Ricinus communis TaxID=3988 RepID=UPI00201ACED6|nr:probable ADP-ribosylation factor GTPase-activating protein AGD14 isoform X2 [Ricinus communis]